MNEIGMPVDGRRGVGRGKMVSTWGARDIDRERGKVKEVVRIRREGGDRATWLI